MFRTPAFNLYSRKNNPARSIDTLSLRYAPTCSNLLFLLLGIAQLEARLTAPTSTRSSKFEWVAEAFRIGTPVVVSGQLGVLAQGPSQTTVQKGRICSALNKYCMWCWDRTRSQYFSAEHFRALGRPCDWGLGVTLARRSRISARSCHPELPTKWPANGMKSRHQASCWASQPLLFLPWPYIDILLRARQRLCACFGILFPTSSLLLRRKESLIMFVPDSRLPVPQS